MKALIAGLLAFVCFSASAQPEWQYFPAGVASSSSGTSYTITTTVIPTSSYSTYTIYTADWMSLSGNANWYAMTTTAVTFKDSNGNNYCTITKVNSLPNVSVSGVTGSATLNRWQVACAANALVTGQTYTLTLTGKSYEFGGGSGSDGGVGIWLQGQ